MFVFTEHVIDAGFFTLLKYVQNEQSLAYLEILEPPDVVFLVRSFRDGQSGWFFAREHNAFLYQQTRFSSFEHISNNLDMSNFFGNFATVYRESQYQLYLPYRGIHVRLVFASSAT